MYLIQLSYNNGKEHKYRSRNHSADIDLWLLCARHCVVPLGMQTNKIWLWVPESWSLLVWPKFLVNY